jgi:capsular exopolysaccharide synthesis family protein
MSRIHEAIRKAAGERKVGESRDLAAAEDVMSTTFSMLGGVDPHPVLEQPSVEQTAPIAPELKWDTHAEEAIFFSEDGNVPCREEFRILRARIYERAKTERLSVIGVGSALAGEGKTFVAANLASAIALQHDRRVLLIDCDLRRGMLSTLLGARETPGLSEYLEGKAKLSDVLQTDSQHNLSLISRGSNRDEAGELISSPRFKELIKHMRQVFDWIVIDTPPAIHFSDAHVIAEDCDGMLLVVTSGKTLVRFAKQVASEFAKHRLLGIVLNRAEQAAARARNYSDYGHYKAKSTSPVPDRVTM